MIRIDIAFFENANRYNIFSKLIFLININEDSLWRKTFGESLN